MAEPASPPEGKEDPLTISAIATLAFLLADVLQMGLGHAALALLTIAPNGILTSAGWSSAYDNPLIDSGGVIVGLAAAALFGLSLRIFATASARVRLFLVLACAFNLLASTGTLFFYGLTDIGDWYTVLQGAARWTPLRTGLIVTGIVTYLGALFLVAWALAHSLGLTRRDRARYARITRSAWLSAMVVSCLAAVPNPLGVKYVLLSDLPMALASDTGLLFVRYFAMTRSSPAAAERVTRSRLWIAAAAILALVFILLLGRGITLNR